MSTPDESPTPLSQQAAPLADPPSWHGPVTELTGRVTKLEATDIEDQKWKLRVDEKLDSIGGNMAVLANAATTVVKDPDFKKHLLSILGSVALILSLAVAALAGRQSAPTPAPAPAPAVTVVMPPKETPQ